MKEEIEIATTPRGLIHMTNSRSRHVRSVRVIDARTFRGRITHMRRITTATPRHPTAATVDRRRWAESSTNRSEMNSTLSSPLKRRK
ncbi:hypothetical protein D3C83_45530 [compost metagenome]